VVVCYSLFDIIWNGGGYIGRVSNGSTDLGNTYSLYLANEQLLIFASAIGVVFIIPLGILEAVSNCSIGLNVISELVGGFVVPGKAIAMNMFKSYGCICLWNALCFARDLKLGHYSKLPPRSMFRAQLVATFISVITVLLSIYNFSAY